MTTTAPVEFYVSEGPSSDRIIDAFKYAFVPSCRMTVSFTGVCASRSKADEKFIAVITGIRYESGNEGLFLIQGNNLTRGGQFSGFYNAKVRKGTFQMDP